jgi:hypothetical protein
MIADPLSMEYPIETAVSPAQVFVLAVSTNGEVTVAPFDGVVTVMACDGTVKVASANAVKSKVFISQTSSDMAVSAFMQLGCCRHCRNKQRGEFTVGVSNEESNRNAALSFEPSCVRREGLNVTCVIETERSGTRISALDGMNVQESWRTTARYLT